MADNEVSHWREQAVQCRRLITALSDTNTISTLNEWIRELEAKIAEAEARTTLSGPTPPAKTER